MREKNSMHTKGGERRRKRGDTHAHSLTHTHTHIENKTLSFYYNYHYCTHIRTPDRGGDNLLHMPIAHLLRRRPPGLELLLVEVPLEHPPESGHRLHPIKSSGVGRGVLVALVVPCGDAVQGGVGTQKVQSLREEGEEIWGDVQVLLQDDGELR